VCLCGGCEVFAVWARVGHCVPWVLGGDCCVGLQGLLHALGARMGPVCLQGGCIHAGMRTGGCMHAWWVQVWACRGRCVPGKQLGDFGPGGWLQCALVRLRCVPVVQEGGCMLAGWLRCGLVGFSSCLRCKVRAVCLPGGCGVGLGGVVRS
jgi:hypothetical protein